MEAEGGVAGTVSWRALLAEATDALSGRAAEARRLVEAASGVEGAEWALGLDRPASARGVAALDAMVGRRAGGEPLQYVLGRWGFRSLDLLVDRRVLIPRPESEVVAGAAVEELRRSGGAPVAVDLGTGSGALALALAVEVPTATVWATDRSEAALAVARANVAGVGRAGARVRVAAGSWFEALPDDLRGGVAVVVANPPYVADDDVLPAEVADWEPVSALRAGPDGLDDLRLIVAGAPGWLAPAGALVVELAPSQAPAVGALARDAGFADVEVGRDLAGRDRYVVARRR